MMLSELFRMMAPGMMGPQGPQGPGMMPPQGFDPASMLGLYQPPPMPTLPQAPGQVGMEGLPPEILEEIRRQKGLTLAQLIGSVPSGQIGTAIAQAAGSFDPIERGFTDDYNQRQQQQYQQEMERSKMESAMATQQHQYQNQSEVAQGAIGLAGELVRAHPDRAQEIQGLMLQSAGDPSALMQNLASWKEQREQEAFMEEAQARQAEALQGMGMDPSMYQMFPDVAEEQMMSREGLGRYQPEPPPQGAWTSAGQGYVFNTAQGPGSAEQIYTPEAEPPESPFDGKWQAQNAMKIYEQDQRRFAAESQNRFGDEEQVRPPMTMEEAFQRAGELRGMAERSRPDFGNVVSGRSSTGDGPGPAAPSLGPAGTPEVDSSEGGVDSQVDMVVRIIGGEPTDSEKAFVRQLIQSGMSVTDAVAEVRRRMGG